MKIQPPLTLSNVGSWTELRRYTSIFLDRIVDAINGRLSVNENLDINIINANFPAANTSYAFNHTLNRLPIGYWVTSKKVTLDVFDGSSPNTTGLIYLKCTAGTSCSVLVF